MMKRNPTIDAMRAVACAAVLFVHAAFPNPLGLYVAALARFAVPFFLMVSGYYAYRPAPAESYAYARRRLRATVRLTLCGTLLYAVSNTIRQLLYEDSPFSWLSSLLSPEGLFNFFVFNRAVFLSSVMYYLFMLIYVYLLLMLMLKTGALRFGIGAVPVLLIACVALDEWFGLPWYYSGNFLLTGLPFFLLGWRIAEKPSCISRPERFILPGVVLTLLETTLAGEVYCYVGTLVTAVAIFLACLKFPQANLPRGLVRFGRKCSVTVFLVHCAVRDYIHLLIPEQPPVFAYLRPLAVLAVSAMIAVMVSAMMSRKKTTLS